MMVKLERKGKFNNPETSENERENNSLEKIILTHDFSN